MRFNYYNKITSYADIEIEDIGNCALSANNDLGRFWYLVIDTEMGRTRIFEYGPVIPDMPLCVGDVYCSVKFIDFDMRKLVNYITKFLNDYKKDITQAIEIDKQTVLNYCKDLVSYARGSIHEN